MKHIIPLILALSLASPASAGRLLVFNDSTENLIAAGEINSDNQTGWNDPTIIAGDIYGPRGHILVAIKDTVKLKAIFNHCHLDSAKLSFVITGIAGEPGNLDFHFIKRDANGCGVHAAYDDNWSSYCRSSWFNRRSGSASSCPDSIAWQTPGATGAADYNAVPFASITSPVTMTRYNIDVTSWIAGVVAGTDSVSNGIILLATGEDGLDVDFFAIANILPFCTTANAMALKLWISNWDWVKVRLDSSRVHDGWITSEDPDTIISNTACLNVGTGAAIPLQIQVGVIFPQDSALFGPDAIPHGSTIDSARLWLHIKNTFTAPNDTIAVGEMREGAVYSAGHFPSWDFAAPGVDWSSGVWSTAVVVRRHSQYVDSVNAWYSWSGSGLAQMLQRWLDSASTRHGLAMWDLGPNSNTSSAWADRTAMAYGAEAGSLLVWITPSPIHPPRRAWIDNPDPVK